MRKREYGLLLAPGESRLTNIRCADDIVLFARNFDDAALMLEELMDELAAAGLSVNSGKTKILTTDPVGAGGNGPLLVEIAGNMVEVLRGSDTHKYLGRLFPGDLRQRGLRNLNHRLACGWLKFHRLRSSLLNKKYQLL